MPDEVTDRYHNREEDSPEALRRSIDALADAVSALDRKLDDVALRLGTDIDGARSVTRHLAGDVALMGEALVRRIENTAPAEAATVAPRRRKKRAAVWIMILVLVSGGAVAAIWLTPHEVERRPTTSTRVIPAPPAPAPPTPIILAPRSSADATAKFRHASRTFTGRGHHLHHPWRPPASESMPEPLPDA